jgi:DNA-binding transcriptional ArsR family regulator
MGDPVRQRILESLSKGSMSAGDIVLMLDMKASAVSYHLKRLRESELIIGTKKGNEIIYHLNLTVVDETIIYLAGLKDALSGSARTGRRNDDR